VVGDYEFDPTEAGAGILVLKFVAVDGALWVQTAASSWPNRLDPVADSDSTFSLIDPKEGTDVVEFLDPDDGRFTRARLTNPTPGVDAFGTRLATPVRFPTLAERLKNRTGLAEPRDDLPGTRVAVYFGRGMGPHSALALGRAFQWMGGEVDVIDADAIRTGALDHIELLAFPGGERNPNPWGELGHEGRSAIRDFVRGGGSCVGIPRGAVRSPHRGLLGRPARHRRPLPGRLSGGGPLRPEGRRAEGELARDGQSRRHA
jgi:hypothetical protein